jgi:hypothetical protein
MTNPPGMSCRHLWILGVACAGCLISVGCGNPLSSAGVSPTERPAVERESFRGAKDPPRDEPASPGADRTSETGPAVVEASQVDPPAKETAEPAPAAGPAVAAKPVSGDRVFSEEGPDGALRIGYDDLDLLKILKMDPVTPDCVEKMPGWLLGLKGKTVRIRGFMKPGLLLSGIPQFMLVRDTGLCCFGPKGKIYDMIAVTLKPGTTTDYIELRPFDVVGTFRIELLQLEEDGTIFGLYYIDDAVILQK